MPFACARFSGNPDVVKAGTSNPSLKQGSNGEAVKILQMALIDLGFAMPASTRTGLPDGIFGQETARVVTAFQRANGLTPDGIAGAKTLARLDLLLTVRSETTARADVIQGRKATGRG
jgi:peptidoglycan hydrolase-like protein with peptidoglycan-binding domain